MGEARSPPPSLADPTNVRGAVLTPRPRLRGAPTAEDATELLFFAAVPLSRLFVMPRRISRDLAVPLCHTGEDGRWMSR